MKAFAKITIIVLFITSVTHCYGQQKIISLFTAEGDSTYYDEFSSMLTVRLYSANKFSDFSIEDDSLDLGLEYKSNTAQVIGLGLSYKGISLNAGYGFSFANQDDSLFGQTKRFDFQTQIQARKLTLNLYSNIYRGYYLSNSKNILNNWPDNKYYTRKDIKGSTLGLSGSYIFNYKRYSNRATFLQNEWQKKSAGSFVAGFSIVYNTISADSSIIPGAIENPDFFGGVDYIQSKNITLGGHVGYVYTLVLFKRLFLNAGVNGGTMLGRNTIIDNDNSKISKTGINFTLLSTLGFGYNSKRFYAGFAYSSITSTTPAPIDQTTLSFSNGMYKVTFAYRLKIRENFRILPENWPVDL